MSKRFQIFSWVTLVSIFLVVIAGGVVRMTGSGMGCPDWPKCFDCYIPPTDVSQLPENYKEIYASKREKKIERFAAFLISLGFDDKAQQLVADKSLLEEQDFSPFNTWTEYINRLCGALAGLLIFIQAVWGFANFKKQKKLAFLALFLILLTGFQAWFGAMVVATNIVPWVLTIHMFLALLMIIVQLQIIHLIRGKREKAVNPLYFWISLVGVAFLFLQTLWGTQVRQAVDVIAKEFERESWIDQLPDIYIYHRSLAIAIILIGAGLFYASWKKKTNQKNTYILLAIILLEALVGKLFSVLGMPAFLQPIHLLLSMIMFAMLYHNLLTTKR